MALGSPISAAGSAAGTIGNAAADALGKVADALKPLADRFRFVADTIKAVVSNTFERIAEAVGPPLAKVWRVVAPVFSRLVESVGPVARAVAGLGLVFQQFVSKANPVVAEQLMLALNDLMAVIGQALVPVFKILTELVRAAADTLTGFLGDIGGTAAAVLRPVAEILKVVFDLVGRGGQVLAKVFEAVSPALQAVATVVLKLVEALAPLVTLLVELLGGVLTAAMEALSSVIEDLAPVVLMLVDVFGRAVKWIVDGIREVLSWLGVELPATEGRRDGASVGAAVRSASTGDIESVLRKSRESAFSLGTASREDPARRTASATESLTRKADEMLAALRDMPERLARAIAGDTIVDAIEDLADTAAEAGDAILDAVLPAGVRDSGPPEGSRVGGVFDRAREAAFRDLVVPPPAGAVIGGDF